MSSCNVDTSTSRTSVTRANPPPSNRAKYEWGSGLMGLSRVIFRSCFSPFIYIKRRYVYKEGEGGYEELVLRYAVLLLTRWWKLPDQFRSSGLLEKAIHRGYQTFGGVYWVIGGNKRAFHIYIFFLVGRRFCLWEKRAKVAEQKMSENAM